ncbi:MAG: hypothetical protein KF705_06880 [Phycisphaeraceae bacterium]|nr:hypothetical protein [Phycisphaeraceae bacterium]
MLKKRLRTVTLVPIGPEAGRTDEARSPSTSICDAPVSMDRRERMERRETEAIEAMASPRKPSVAMAEIAALRICQAWGAMVARSSSGEMPNVAADADEFDAALLEIDGDSRGAGVEGDARVP